MLRTLTLLTLTILLALPLAAQTATMTDDGALTTPIQPEAKTKYRITGFAVQRTGDDQATAEIVVHFLSAGGTPLDWGKIQLTQGEAGIASDNDVSALLAALGTPIAGEGWFAGLTAAQRTAVGNAWNALTDGQKAALVVARLKAFAITKAPGAGMNLGN